MLSEENELILEDQVMSKLDLEGYTYLMEVVHLMPKGLQEAILEESLPLPWYVQMRERVGELKRGHLSNEEEDSSPGAIHWFEGLFNTPQYKATHQSYFQLIAAT